MADRKLVLTNAIVVGSTTYDLVRVSMITDDKISDLLTANCVITNSNNDILKISTVALTGSEYTAAVIGKTDSQVQDTLLDSVDTTEGLGGGTKNDV